MFVYCLNKITEQQRNYSWKSNFNSVISVCVVSSGVSQEKREGKNRNKKTILKHYYEK